MLNIFNKEFFSFDVAFKKDIVDNVPVTLASLNILVDPQAFDLKHYRKVPFASFAVTQWNDTKDISTIDTQCLVDRYFTNAVYSQYSKYEDSGYEEMLTNFPDNKAHTLIFNDPNRSRFANTNYINKVLLVIAIPIKGIIAPIRKSSQYKLYNGSFISCKMFKWQEQYYNKLVYLLVDMRSSFSFQEYVQTSDSEVGIMHNYYFTLQPKSYDDYTVKMQRIDSVVPYEGRDDLFSKSDRNLFYLMDIPSEIINRKDSISVQIKSD
jgi:hypothetical protein